MAKGGEESELRSVQVTNSYKKGVKISVYVESSTLRFGSQNKEHLNRVKLEPVCKTSGYCRRSQLLAYARELRASCDNKEEEEEEEEHAKPKSEKWRRLVSSVFVPRSVRWRFQNRKRRKKKKKIWSYEAMGSDETEISRGKWRHVFCAKLMDVVKDLFSCGCRR